MLLFDFTNKLSRVQTNVSEMQPSLRVSQYDTVRLIRMVGRGGRTSVVIPPAEQVTMVVPLRPDAANRCEVTFTSRLLRVPAKVQTGSKDTRALGAHFYAFDYSPPR